MDNRKGEDLNETINKIRKDYEKAALKNREDTETWYQSKVGFVEEKNANYDYYTYVVLLSCK